MSTSSKAEPQAKERLAPNGLSGYSVVERLGKPIAIVNNANGAMAAEIYGHNVVDITGGALPLARLIAAAPELLAALKAIADELLINEEAPRPYSGDSYLPAKFKDQITAAIAKAEGRA